MNILQFKKTKIVNEWLSDVEMDEAQIAGNGTGILFRC